MSGRAVIRASPTGTRACSSGRRSRPPIIRARACRKSCNSARSMRRAAGRARSRKDWLGQQMKFNQLKRREFLTLLGGAAAWPLAARAQQGERVRRVGAILGSTGTGRSDVAAFQQALEQLGWIDGRNVRMDYRFGSGNAADVRRYTAELIALAPDVILAGGDLALVPMLQATRSLPIVFAGVIDPVGAGFVESLSRPGGNATGFIQFEYSLSGKWLQLLKEIAPSVTRAAVLRDAGTTG